MSTLIKVVISFVISLFLVSCNLNFGGGVKGNGNVITEQRGADETIESVKATEGLDVFVTQSESTSIKVEADENVIDLIETSVSNGTLKISCKEPIGRVSSKKVYVSLPKIVSLESSSGADMSTMGTIEANEISLDASSGSDIEAELQATSVTLKASSGAEIEVYGVTETLKANASSGADINAHRLKAKIVKADASSGADIEVNAANEIAIHKSSGGEVSYNGSPKIVENVKID
ncbi:head GIN domain-containing protein [Galbibacter mesophilus]|uniref:head GIN domain-containing protein n=1 Tax=Galbibacter mesophilus TaxID=379069 RepID=UPI00191E876C|nr:head GIN domain-containing protein [Galbibacter mesophilus]MCM5662791.1 DUF2807 domain-containing protein [Galbibacter mesophilus]